MDGRFKILMLPSSELLVAQPVSPSAATAVAMIVESFVETIGAADCPSAYGKPEDSSFFKPGEAS